MSEKIRLMVVDDLATTRETVIKLLQFATDVTVIGEAATGRQAVDMAREKKPDVILMDINMPDMDGITASQHIVRMLPATQIIIMSVQSDTDYIRKAMLAGARDFLNKPFSLDELLTAVHTAYERSQSAPSYAPAPVAMGRPGSVPEAGVPAPAAVTTGKVIAVFSPKGGSGCTTVAVNTAVALARSGVPTILVDGSFQFGDVGLMLNLKGPATMLDLVERSSNFDTDLLSSILTTHRSGLKVLLAPPRPEMAELITVDHIKTIFNALRDLGQFVIVDTSVHLNDVNLAILDLADEILLITPPNLPGIKNASRFLDLANELSYQMDKVKLVVNGVADKRGIALKDISATLKRPVVLSIPEDITAETAADQGEPLVEGPLQKRPIAVALNRTAVWLKEGVDGQGDKDAAKAAPRRSFLARLFGRG
jgi:pilus assembly protein CpaE